MTDWILYFFIYSIGGYLMETVYCFFCTRQLSDRKTMHKSPMCPVYGFGAVSMAALLSGFHGNFVLLFCGGFLICSAVEYMYSMVTERAYCVVWWDYRHRFANLDGRVCASCSVLWGLLAVVFIQWVHPTVVFALSYAPAYSKLVAAMVLGVIFLSDLAITHDILSNIAKGKIQEEEFGGLRPIRKGEL
jgi:uncharacterized membrane protein